MTKSGPKLQIGLIGHEPALALTKDIDAPDQREVSLKWLAGTFLTGATSITLMGAALFIALDGKQLLATPPELATSSDLQGERALESDGGKGSRIVSAASAIQKPAPTDRRRMSVSTITRQGDSEIIRTKPFEHVKIALAADHRTDAKYPAFNPLTIFAEDEATAKQNTTPFSSVIYGASVETEASIRTVDFVYDEEVADAELSISDNEAEEIVRNTASILADGRVEVASLYYVDPIRFGPSSDPALANYDLRSMARIIPENISVAEVTENLEAPLFYETVIKVEKTEKINTVFKNTGNSGAEGMAEAFATLLNTNELKSGYTVRLGVQDYNDSEHIVRSSIYDGNEHVLTIALNDQNQYVPAPEPVDEGIMDAANGDATQETLALLSEKDRPTAYDAIYRAILSYELPKEMAARIVRMVAADVDFQSRIRASDKLSLFYSIPEEGDEDQSRELLYVEASFGGQTRKFYRFVNPEGEEDFYDETGRSARQFLIRNPVPTGRFRSGFGMRRHPILKYSKMHWGVDWSAPRGTPIIAPGNGVVKKAGWAGGYGKQTVLTHANGYETSYSHQTRFANGIVPGARVRQGQVIGYIGTTGLSTGPHLHYEMWVNGKRVDPMRVRLPKGGTLENEQLEAFKRERDRIDALLTSEENAEIAAL